MHRGYISLWRKIEDNEFWLAEPFTKAQAWIDLVMLATHKKKSFFIRAIEIKLTRGQLGRSELSLGKRWKWSRNKVRRFLKVLETKQQIEQRKTSVTSIITILNYDEYQTPKNIFRCQKVLFL